MPYNNDTNYDNEVKYLNGLMTNGTTGQKSWANQQMGVLNKWYAGQQKPPTQPTQPTQPMQPQKPPAPTFNDIYQGMFNGFGFNAGNYISEQQKAIDAQVNQYLSEQQAYYDKLGGQLTSQYDTQRGQMDEMYQQSQDDINKQTYESMERSKAMGSMRGMTSSAQQVGMDNAVGRAGMDAHSANAKNRQSSLEKLNNQLNQARDQLAVGYDQALKSSQAQKTQLMGNAQKEAQNMLNQYNQMAFNGALQMYGKQQDYAQQDKMFDKNANHELNIQGNQFAQQDKDRLANFAQQEKMWQMNFDGDLVKMDKQNGFDLGKMAKQHGYDLEKMNIDFSNKWKIMTEQERQQTNRAMAQISAQKQMAQQQRAWMKEDQYADLQNRLDQKMLDVIIGTADADRANEIRTTGKGSSPSQHGNNIRNHYNAYLGGYEYGGGSGYTPFGYEQSIINQFFDPSSYSSNILDTFGGSSNNTYWSPTLPDHVNTGLNSRYF